MVFGAIDDGLKALGLTRLPPRGPRRTALAESEGITIEVVGELRGITDVGPLPALRRPYAAEFPALTRVHRATSARQAANLCWAKRPLRRRLAGRLRRPEEPWLVDSLPLPACLFARAHTCRRFAGQRDRDVEPAVRVVDGGSVEGRLTGASLDRLSRPCTIPDRGGESYRLRAARRRRRGEVVDTAPGGE